MDLSIFSFFHGIAGHSALLDGVVVFLARNMIYLLVLGAVFFVFNLGTWKEKFFAFIFITLTVIVSRGIFTEIIRFFYDRERPFERLGFEPLFTDFHPGFPSGHTAFLFALSFGIFYFSRFWGGWFLAASLLVGIGRVVAGVHFPLDILGGIGVALLSFFAVQGLLKNHRPETGVI